MSWLPLSLRTFDGEPVTATDTARPEVHNSLMLRQRNTLAASVLSVPPTVLMFAAILWPHASHRGLVAWIVLVFGTAVGHWWLHLRLPLERVTITRLSIAHANGGLSWALLPLVAMPREPEWQAMVGAFMVAVLAAGMVFASQFVAPFTGWVLGVSIPSITGYVLLDSSLGTALIILATAAALFATVLGAVLRAGDLGASVFAARNADLVQELQVDKQQLRELATTDPLTGTRNRLAFNQDLISALESGADRVALAIVDLDNFKHINDSLGHHAGDQVLQSIVGRIEGSLKSDEHLYRIGGDELTIIQRRATAGDTLEELGDRLIASFDKQVSGPTRPIDVSASIGIACADVSRDVEALQRGADDALYRAKRSATSKVEYFDAAMQLESAREATLRKDVSRAVRTGEIVPWLQPIVELQTGKVIGAEALARWERPNGVHSAATFIDAVEESGMAAELDAAMFDAVCFYRERLEEIQGNSFGIATNVAPTFLRQFVDRYEETGMLRGAIIEVTEQRDLTNHEQLSRLIERAQACGADVVVDDFGTGFSSMERLSLGSFDGLKIDGSFVQSITDRRNSAAIVASIAEIGRILQIPVVAEGIESSHHATRLLDYGVQWGQGYLYSPAMPFDEFEAMLKNQKARGPHFAHLAQSPQRVPRPLSGAEV